MEKYGKEETEDLSEKRKIRRIKTKTVREENNEKRMQGNKTKIVRQKERKTK